MICVKYNIVLFAQIQMTLLILVINASLDIQETHVLSFVVKTVQFVLAIFALAVDKIMN